MPNPFRSDPGSTWAKNFRRQVSETEKFNDDESLTKYKRGVEAAFDQTDQEVNVGDDNIAVQNFSDVQGDYTADAVKALTVLAASAYMADNDVSGVSNTGNIAGITDYDSANPDSGDPSNFEVATEVLGQKFVENWAGAYE